jgi:hypothetical protein
VSIAFSKYAGYCSAMNTFRSIIDQWPSLQDFAADLEVKYVTAQLMRHRDSIAAKHWRNTVAAASKRGMKHITLDLLASIEPRAAIRRARPRGQRQAIHA